MAQMDLAGGNAAMRRARGRCVTVAVDGMVFHQPVLVGDEVSLYGAILRIGRTSMTIRVEAWRRSRTDEAEHKVTEGTFTFVAIDENRKPRPVPPANVLGSRRSVQLPVKSSGTGGLVFTMLIDTIIRLTLAPQPLPLPLLRYLGTPGEMPEASNPFDRETRERSGLTWRIPIPPRYRSPSGKSFPAAFVRG